MQPFAKLYSADDVGQVLVTIDEYTVMIRFIPPGLGLSALRCDLPDTEAGRQKAAHLFSLMTETTAVKQVRDLLSQPDFEKLLQPLGGSLDA